MNISQVIDYLKLKPTDQVVSIGFGAPYVYHKGCSCLGVELTPDVSVGDMLYVLRHALGTTCQGWQGRDFVMKPSTDVCIAPYGETGESITHLLLDDMFRVCDTIATSAMPRNVQHILRTLTSHDYDAYVIGGAVRDMSLGRPPSDWDVFTNATGEEIMALFPYGDVIGSEDHRAMMYTVIVKGVEVSQYRRNGDRTETGVSLERHLSTCDFTINSIAMDANMNTIDLHGGKEDLCNAKLRCVGDATDRLDEDPLRAFRAIRFAAKYDLEMDAGLLCAIRTVNIDHIPIERIREEVLKIMRYPNGMRWLCQYQMLQRVIPELNAVYNLHGGNHHMETVDEHLWYAQDVACELTDYPALIFACAFHDIGKGACVSADGHFHDHDRIGATMLHDIVKRLKCSAAFSRYVETLVSEHMFAYAYGTMTDRALTRHFRRLEDAKISIMDYMVMLYSDCQANQGNSRIKFADFVSGSELLQAYYRMKFSSAPFRVTDLEISGKDLLDMGIESGVGIGRGLEHIFDRVSDGLLENKRHELLHYTQNNLKTFLSFCRT